MPAILVNGALPPSGQLVASDRPNITADVSVVDTIPTFPGMKVAHPLLVLPEGRAGEIETRLNRLVWTTASGDEVRKAAADAGRPIVYLVHAAADHRHQPSAADRVDVLVRPGPARCGPRIRAADRR